MPESPGLFSSEREVVIRAERNYSLLVDAHSLRGGLLAVRLIEEVDGLLLIELPRETFSSGRRIRVPRGLIEREVAPWFSVTQKSKPRFDTDC